MNPFPIDTKARDNTLVAPAKSLPKVLWRNKIISLLDYHSHLRLSLSCKYFHELFETYWQNICKNKWSVTTLESERTWNQRYGKVSGKFIALAAELKKIHCIKTLKGHPENIISLHVTGNKLISVSEKRIYPNRPDLRKIKIIKIWDLEEFKCLETVEWIAPYFRRFCFPIFENKIIFVGSALSDKYLRASDRKINKFFDTGERHNANITCLLAVDNIVISGAEDGNIKIWDLKIRKCLKTIEAHTESIKCLQAVGNTFISGTYESTRSTIKIWDLKTGECLKILKSPDRCMRRFQVVGNTIIFTADFYSSSVIWDLETNKQLLSLGDQSAIDLQIAGNKIISGHMDKTIKIWDIKSNLQKESLKNECQIF